MTTSTWKTQTFTETEGDDVQNVKGLPCPKAHTCLEISWRPNKCFQRYQPNYGNMSYLALSCTVKNHGYDFCTRHISNTIFMKIWTVVFTSSR